MSKEIPQPNARIKKEAALVLTGVMAIGGTGIANAQENSDASPSITPEVNPIVELCVVPATITSNTQEQSNGDVIVFESPTPNVSPEPSISPEIEAEEHLNAYQRFTNILNQETYPECDYNTVISQIYKYINEKGDEGVIDKDILKTYKSTLEAGEFEMDKKTSKRTASPVAQGLIPLFSIYSTIISNNEDNQIDVEIEGEKIFHLTEAYVAATAPKVPTEEYIENAKQFLEGYKDVFSTVQNDSEVTEIDPTQDETDNTDEQPEASPNPNPELDLNKYSIKEFLKLRDETLTEKGFNKIIKKVAPILAEYENIQGDENTTPTDKFVKEELEYLKDIKRGWSMDWAGFSIATYVAKSVEKAEAAAKKGEIKVANAYIDLAQAYVRIGKTNIDFKKSPTELDKEILKAANY